MTVEVVHVASTGQESERVTFFRHEPAEHALLVTKLGDYALKRTEAVLPGGTSWATAHDLAEAGFVPMKAVERAVRLLAVGGSRKEALSILREALPVSVPVSRETDRGTDPKTE